MKRETKYSKLYHLFFYMMKYKVIANSNIISFFHFVNKRASYSFVIILLAHALLARDKILISTNPC